MERNRISTLGILMVIGGLCLGWGGCQTNDKQAEARETPEDVEIRPEVIFDMADDQPLYTYVETQGRIYAQREIELKARVSGYLEDHQLRDGQQVAEGETLLQLEDEEWQLSLAPARQEYQKALSDYQIEKKMRDASSDTTNDEMLRIQKGVTAAKVELDRAKLNVSYTTMTAPFTGRISTDQRYSPGQYISAGTVLGKLVQTDQVLVRFALLSEELVKVKKGQSITIEQQGQTFEGTITQLAPVVDEETHTGYAWAQVENEDRALVPGMLIEGRILVERVDGDARIPRQAILERDDRWVVFKLNDATKEVSWVYVKPQRMTNEWAIINNPQIAPGDTVAVDRHFTLSHLQKVEPKIRY
ncbi:MAG: efflux RND transporter periplasmic adaptor subunit [Bacteroidota bacterium]